MKEGPSTVKDTSLSMPFSASHEACDIVHYTFLDSLIKYYTVEQSQCTSADR